MKKYLKYLLILPIVGLAVAYYMYNKPHEQMAGAKATYELSANELFSEFEGDEAAANEKYLDEVIEVEGTVKAVSQDEDGTVSITLSTDGDMFGVICQLDNLSTPKRTEFEVGEKVAFKGICTGMLMDVVLVRCVEVDI